MTQQEQINQYLSAIRDSGAINMAGATPYIQEAFGLSKYEAREALMAWINSLRKVEQ